MTKYSVPPRSATVTTDSIVQSLTIDGFATPEIAAAWAEEVERRIAAYDRGDVKAAGADVAIERMRRHLAEHRTRKVRS